MRNQLRIAALLIVMALPMGVMGQNGIIGDGFGTVNWSTTDCFSSGAGGSRILTLSPSGTGNKYFRLVTCWDGIWNQWGPSSSVNDFQVPIGTVVPSSEVVQNSTSKAYFINVPNSNYQYVFKTRGGGNPPSNPSFVVFEVQGSIRTISSISRDIEVVESSQDVVVTANLSGSLSEGQTPYLRYTTDNYGTSTIVAMTGSGTSYTATIPSGVNSELTTVKYYVFTSGTGLAIPGSDADFFSINTSTGGEYTVVVDLDPPAAIALTSPADAATSIGLRPTFTWEENVDATTYQIQVSTVNDFTSTVISATGLTAATHAATANLLMNTTYFWRVRGVNGGGNGAWSDVRSFTTVPATITLRGNGGGDFGGPVGGSTLHLTHDDTHLYFEFTKGAGNWNDVLVLYFDTKSGGVTSTDPLTDVADNHRRAISGNLSDITFPTGFTADYALAMNTVFGGVWTLAENGTFGTPVATPTVPSGVGLGTHSFRISKSAMTFDTENTFSILGSYLNGSNGFRSNESFSIGLVDTNPGDADVTLRSFHNYPSGSITADVKFFGNAGWRFLANPFAGLTLNDYVSPLWTQGFPGSDAPGAGVSNVLHMNSSGAYASVANQSDAMTRGKGYVVGVFTDNTHGQAGSFPKTVTVTGTPSYESVSAPLNGAEAFALVGNPFPYAIGFDNLTRTGVAQIAYVYDYVDVSASSPDVDPGVGIYRAWNGSTGSLAGGRIASFQSFLVYADGETPSLTIDAADRTSPTLYFGKDVAARNFELVLKGNGLYSNAWVDISDNASIGLDSKDAFKLSTFDAQQARLFTVSGDVALDINHLPVSDAVEIPLGIESTKSGMMRLERGSWDIPAEWGVYVRDTQSGVVRELKEGIAMDVEPTRITRKASASNQIERVAAVAPRYTLIIDPLSTTSAESREHRAEGRFELAQNYPNPFNPSTQIRFTLRTSNFARLTVYDVLGREVAVLVDGNLPAGSHTVTFDASNLTSGVYLYKLEADGQVQTKRMTLLK